MVVRQKIAAKEPWITKIDNVEAIDAAMVDYLVHVVGRDPEQATRSDWFQALAALIRGELSERYIRTTRTQAKKDAKRVYYLSMEYLLGRSLGKQLLDLGIRDNVETVLEAHGHDLEDIEEEEHDAALGNGGLGRLAACFLDSLATHDYPGFGYGIRYEFGMFRQRIENGQQIEHPENWLRYGSPWEFARPDVSYKVPFYSRLVKYEEDDGEEEVK